MANLTPVNAWSALDVQHFARRAGFGLTPETIDRGGNRSEQLHKRMDRRGAVVYSF